MVEKYGVAAVFASSRAHARRWHAQSRGGASRHGARRAARRLWGMATFVAAEAALFAMMVGTYFYLRFKNLHWPPPGIPEPKLLVPLVLLGVLLASIAPVQLAYRAARAGRLGARAPARPRRARRAGRLLRDGGHALPRRSAPLRAAGACVRVDLLRAARGRARARRDRAAAQRLAARKARARADAVPAERAAGDRALLVCRRCDHARRHPHRPLAAL